MTRLWTIRALVAVLALAKFAWVPAHAQSGFTRPASLIVVTDDNYPPYLFRTAEGQLQGILKDKWDLWSRKNGVPVQLEGMEWAKAQQSVLAGKADIIDALSYSEARERLYAYSPPYATIEARVFFHHSVSGINDVASMRGFSIGAKEGSACASWLKERGMEGIRGYSNSESLVHAAGAGEIRLFCMDTPTAQYFLFKQGIADKFRQTPPLYSSHFHWATAKGRTDLRDFVQKGYENITAEELRNIDDRWSGSQLKLPIDTRQLYYLAILVVAILSAACLLALWNRTLRKRVAARTAQLNGQTQVLELIADGAPLEKILDTLVRVVESPSNGMFGSVLLLNDDGVHLRHGAAPSLPESYARAIDGAAIGERAGSCGTAVFRRELVVVQDIATDPLWENYRGLAAEHGLRACWSSPIFDAHRRVLGTFALYYLEPRKPTRRHLRLIDMATHAAAIAISKRREQDRIARLNRINAVLSSINSAIVHIKERGKLLEEACRIAVEYGKFGIAWIGMLDPNSLDINPVASAGVDADSLIAKSRNSANPDTPLGQGIVGRAIRERRAVFSNDIITESTYGGARRQEAIRRGYRSLISLPLLMGGESIGSLSLFALESNFFDDEEIRLLTELAGNISFALEHMAQQEKIEKLSRIRAVSGEINAAIVRIRERRALLAEVNRIAAEHGKFEMVWIGAIDAAREEISAVAWTGFSAEVANRVSWKSISSAHGTLAEAVNTRQPAVRIDINELSAGGMRGEALARGCRSTVCMPLTVDDKVVALVALFATGKGFFDADELALLEDVASDISLALQTMEKQEKLDYLSYYDPITSLPNRTLFIDRAGQQMRSRGNEPLMVALILFNIERFRNINETFGRNGGDELLKLIALRLEQTFRGKDYLARIAADTFGVVVRGIRDAAAVMHTVENQILGCFREPYRLQDSELRVVAKAGVGMYPADGQDADTLFKNAEAALRKAQDSGERYLFYAADMNARAAHVLSLETRLRKAVEARQFVLHYQPKMDLAQKAVCGMESLIRWQDPQSGLVAPGMFIPLLEETGLILEVGRWAIARALAQHHDWLARGIRAPRIAVNVSAIQLQQRDFTDVVVAAVQEGGGNCKALELEVTESLLMRDIRGTINKLDFLRKLGIHVAMDDFGTGYSSLSYLTRLPIDSVKIDRSFITGMNASPQDMSIVTTIIALAHSLNLRVVAEGVETEDQSKLLTLLKCDEAQGYLFSKPLPAAEIEAMLRASAQPQSVTS